jgi:hypothetical protein
VFRAQWLQPLDKLSNSDLGDYGKWLEREMGRMTVSHREQAKRVFHALRGEMKRRRQVARGARRLLAAR